MPELKEYDPELIETRIREAHDCEQPFRELRHETQDAVYSLSCILIDKNIPLDPGLKQLIAQVQSAYPVIHPALTRQVEIEPDIDDFVESFKNMLQGLHDYLSGDQSIQDLGNVNHERSVVLYNDIITVFENRDIFYLTCPAFIDKLIKSSAQGIANRNVPYDLNVHFKSQDLLAENRYIVSFSGDCQKGTVQDGDQNQRSQYETNVCLQVLVYNLVGNAIKHGFNKNPPEEPEIEVIYEHEMLSDGSSLLTVRNNNSLNVEGILKAALDDAKPIPENPTPEYVLSVLMERGFSTGPRGDFTVQGENGGFGLGMIAQRFNKIELEYDEGFTEFRVYLPKYVAK